MGYFPLPELKGKPNRIFVDGKTLNQIAKESGIRLDTVQHRYSRGIRDYTLFWGMGNWTRANAELCLLGVRGKPKRMDAGVHSVIMSHIEEHSKKPAETRDRIVKLMAGGAT